MASDPRQKLLLTDATMPVSFAKAGIGAARAMATHLGDRVHIVDDVLEELRLKAERDRLVSLQTLLKEWPPSTPRLLDEGLKQKAALILRARRAPGEHAKEDLGEVVTVLYAEKQRDDGEVFEIITDDGFGKELARQRSFTPITTPTLIVEMVCGEAISYDDGKRVWRMCFSNRAKWSEYEGAVDRECGSKKP